MMASKGVIPICFTAYFSWKNTNWFLCLFLSDVFSCVCVNLYKYLMPKKMPNYILIPFYGMSFTYLMVYLHMEN